MTEKRQSRSGEAEWEDTVGLIEEENDLHSIEPPTIEIEEVKRGDGSTGYAPKLPNVGIGGLAPSDLELQPESIPIEAFDGPSTAVAFQLAVYSTSPWPESCVGVSTVLEAVQRALTAASQGQERVFMAAWNSLDASMRDWRNSLWK